MNIVRRNVMPSPLDLLRHNFDRLLTTALDPFESFAGPTFPALNVWESGDTILAEAEVPGMKLEELEVLVVGDELTIKGTRTIERESGEAVLRQERFSGEFSRTVTLPADVDAGKVEATLKNGVLSIRMPKSEHTRARKIAVKSA